ncbi:DUF58 domain-containing protein [Streptomyces sp. LP05-1]|uniref:DUF58 domain-containing protein n=1 Tax=Streptomyces pyxinae TaxID=2970734 RepID=A0ABT2CH05_9ACTN|nr:DUF58 domain-containing protein [Streptomyces sp. LP05-1]MCS0636392.1 DUF58 domain-containing protein [Streptomyces sp. LP05-1]
MAAGEPAGPDAGARGGEPAGPDDDARAGAPERAERGGVRAALGGLTTRGRSFLAAGIAAGACAYVLGQPDLLRVGLLLAALPLVCALVLLRTRHRVAGTRGLEPRRVPSGSETRVLLRMDNVSRLPTGLLLLQDQVPYVLGPRPRFVLDRVEAGGRREVSYRVRSDLRGRFALGPLQLRLSDPFGMCELTRSFGVYDTLTVVPRTEPLPPVRLAGDSSGYGDGRQSTLALAGEDDVIPRGYRTGDDLRRVHWRSTARRGELMVRREEQPQRARCTVLLDTRETAYQGAGPESAFEWAVSGAASVLTHMLERGFAVRLLTDAGPVPAGTGADGFAGTTQDAADAAGLLLDALAVVGHSGGAGLSRAYEALGGSADGLLVAFVGDLDEEQAAMAARMRQRSAGAVAFVVDSGAWLTGGTVTGAVEDRVRRLREAGWTALAVAPGTSLGELWRSLAGPGVAAPAAGAGRVAGGYDDRVAGGYEDRVAGGHHGGAYDDSAAGGRGGGFAEAYRRRS